MKPSINIKLRYIMLLLLLLIAVLALVENRRFILQSLKISGDEIDELLQEDPLLTEDSLGAKALEEEKSYADPLPKYSYFDEEEMLQLEVPSAETGKAEMESVSKRALMQESLPGVPRNE
jgi:hypothetical protein